MTIEDKVKAFRQWLDTKRESFADAGSYDDANIINGIISIYDAVFDVCKNKKDSHSDFLENYGTQLLFYLSNYIDTALLRLKEREKEELVTMKKLQKIVRTCAIDSYRDFLNTKQGTDREKGSKLLYNLFVYIDKALTAETKEND